MCFGPNLDSFKPSFKVEVSMTLRMTQNIFMPMKINSSSISITLESGKIIRTEKC